MKRQGTKGGRLGSSVNTLEDERDDV